MPENLPSPSPDSQPAQKPAVPVLSEKNCVICGAPFMPRRRNQVVCCDECRYIRSLQRMQAANEKRRHIDLSPRPCVICGTVFTPSRKDEVCCSPACKGEQMLVRSRAGCLKRYYADPERYNPAALRKRFMQLEQICLDLQAELAHLKSILSPPATASDLPENPLPATAKQEAKAHA